LAAALGVGSAILQGYRGHQGRLRLFCHAEGAGAPAPAVTVPVTGAVIIVSGLAVMLGVLADLAALLITGFCS
jgi:uncharacterized membrane protein YphA (DoxX/SURF4 family)